MKKLPLFCILSALAMNAHAHKAYFKIGLGHNIPVSGQSNTSYDNLIDGKISYSGNGSLSDYELKRSTVNSGMQGIVGGGIMFTPYIGVEVNATIGFAPKKNKSDYSYPYDATTYISESYTMHSRTPVMINPSLVLKTPGKKVNMYARAGFVLPLFSGIKGEFNGTISEGGFSYNYKGEHNYKTYFSLGFSGAMGVSIKATKSMNIWAEANLTSLSLFVKERELTAYSVADRDILSLIPANEKNVKYAKERENNTSQMAYTLPFSNAGVNAGVSFDF